MSDQPKLESTIRDVVLTRVGTKTVGQNNTTMWEMETEGGPTITTFLAGLGNKATALYEQGTVVDLVVSVVQNGKYTNYYLEKIQPSADQTNASPVRQAASAAQQAQAAAPEVSFKEFSAMANKERTSIHRQTAAKVAATLTKEHDGPADFWANVEQIVAFFETGVIPGTVPPTVTGEQTFAPAPVDEDIPF